MQSLPRLRKNTLATTSPASSALRALAARRLMAAHRAGRVSGEAARRAMSEGEGGVAKALLPHLYQCEMETAVPQMPVGNSLALAPEHYAALAPLVREMCDEGVLTKADLAGITRENAGLQMIALALRGTRRMAIELASMMPPANNDYTPFEVSPMAISRIGDVRSAVGDFVPDEGEAHVTMGDTPVVVIPRVESPEEMSAICCVLRAISERSGNWMMIEPADVLELVDPMLVELVQDIKVALGSTPLTAENVPASVRDMIEEYYGPIEGDPEDVGAVIDRLNEAVRCHVKPEPWKMGDGNVQRWLTKGEGRNAQIVQKLLDFYESMPKGRTVDKRESLGDGTCDLMIVDEATWIAHEDTIQMFGQEYWPVDAFRVKRSARNRRPHVAALRAALMAATAATATARIIIDATSSLNS